MVRVHSGLPYLVCPSISFQQFHSRLFPGHGGLGIATFICVWPVNFGALLTCRPRPGVGSLYAVACNG